MISYYELLGMIKEGKAPNKIRVHLTSEPRIYKRDDDIEEYCYYVLDNKDEENDDYKYYLMESYLESMIFDEDIEILDEKKIPKEIIGWYELNETYDKELIKIMLDELKDKYNEIIKYLKSKGE